MTQHRCTVKKKPTPKQINTELRRQLMKVRWYKVVEADMSPIMGSSEFVWKRGLNVEPKRGKLVLCRRGLHVTARPRDWYINNSSGRRVFVAKPVWSRDWTCWGSLDMDCSRFLSGWLRSALPRAVAAYRKLYVTKITCRAVLLGREVTKKVRI